MGRDCKDLYLIIKWANLCCYRAHPTGHSFRLQTFTLKRHTADKSLFCLTQMNPNIYINTIPDSQKHRSDNKSATAQICRVGLCIATTLLVSRRGVEWWGGGGAGLLSKYLIVQYHTLQQDNDFITHGLQLSHVQLCHKCKKNDGQPTL